MLELVYTKASDNYVLVNNTNKKYCIISVKYKTYAEIENVLDMKISAEFDNMSDFKKHYKGYK